MRSSRVEHYGEAGSGLALQPAQRPPHLRHQRRQAHLAHERRFAAHVGTCRGAGGMCGVCGQW